MQKSKIQIKIKKFSEVTIAVLGSHSALDVCRGAKDEGFKTLVIVEKGRDKTYAQYYRTSHPESRVNRGAKDLLGCVDEVLYVNKFKDILSEKIQKTLRAKNAIFIPHRSFEVYINDYDAIENSFEVPMFGNRRMLRLEERTQSPNQYDVLEKAGIKYPRRFHDPTDIDRLVIVKSQEKERSFERGFFLARNKNEFYSERDRRIKEGKIAEDAIQNLIIEEFVLGAQVNFNFFYSTINNRLELIGTDTRRQTNLDGILRLIQERQNQIISEQHIDPTYEEAGHIAVTILESLLEPAFMIGEKFVEAARQIVPPGVIGPFSLQSVITPGPPKKEIVVFDVSPRMPGSPGIAATPYSQYLYGHPVSMGRRVAMEIKEAIAKNKLNLILN